MGFHVALKKPYTPAEFNSSPLKSYKRTQKEAGSYSFAIIFSGFMFNFGGVHRQKTTNMEPQNWCFSFSTRGVAVWGSSRLPDSPRRFWVPVTHFSNSSASSMPLPLPRIFSQKLGIIQDVVCRCWMYCIPMYITVKIYICSIRIVYWICQVIRYGVSTEYTQLVSVIKGTQGTHGSCRIFAFNKSLRCSFAFLVTDNGFLHLVVYTDITHCMTTRSIQMCCSLNMPKSSHSLKPT